MPDLDALQVTLTLASALLLYVAVIKAAIPIWHWFGKVSGRVSGALDNLGGRPAFTDHATGQLVPAIPPLGERLTGMEATLSSLADVNGRLDAHQRSLLHLDERATVTEEHVKFLIRASEERTEIRRESAAMFDAMAKRDSDVIDPQTEP